MSHAAKGRESSRRPPWTPPLLLRAAPLVLAAAVLLPSCATFEDGAPTQGLPAAAARPHDPWVLRCVLDGKPRMLVVALDQDLWAAYDTQNCTLYRTWRGDVNFDGPVYTTAHGPQPTTRGDVLPDPLENSRWVFVPPHSDYLRTREFLARLGDGAPVRFRGHRLVDGHVQLAYDVIAPDGTTVSVRETIEVSHPPDGGVDFLRRFDFDGSTEATMPQLIVRDGRDVNTLPDLDPALVHTQLHIVTNRKPEPGEVTYALGFGQADSVILVHHAVDVSVPPGTSSPATAPAAPSTGASR